MKRLPSLRALFRRPTGGQVPPHQPSGTGPSALSPGGLITDPDKAEALGLTADARRMRRNPTA